MGEDERGRAGVGGTEVGMEREREREREGERERETAPKPRPKLIKPKRTKNV